MSTSINQTLGKSLLLFAAVPVLFACSKSKFSAAKSAPIAPIEETRNPRDTDRDYRPRPTRPYSPPEYNNNYKPPVSDCQDYEYDYPKYTGPKAVNVWVVMDGSKSNTPERYKQLLGIVEMYESTIARDIPIRLAVVTGHSKQSNDSALSGNAFFQRTNEPFVLTFGHGNSQRSQMLKHLEQKILGMRTDNSDGISDGGELLTVNLLAALKNQNAMNTVKQGDILNIHFIGDENDICSIGQVEDYDKIKVNGQVVSREFYARSLNCKHMKVTNNGKGYSKTLADTINKIHSSKRAIVHTSGFVYTNEDTVPRTSATDENEVGRGIVDLIEATGGKSFDLATLLSGTGGVNNEAVYAAGAEMMEYINTSSNMYEKVQATDRYGKALDLSDVDYERSQVYVDGRAVEYHASADGYINLNRRCPVDGRKLKFRHCRRQK